MHMIRTGEGPKLLLVHGLGSNAASWAPIAPVLAQGRELIAIDLPGHGETPAQSDSGTVAGLARSLEAFLGEHQLTGVDAVGLSLGGRLVLEMARRGRIGAAVALDPGGFWEGWERSYVRVTLGASVWLLRRLGAALPALAAAPPSRAMLLAQFSNRPWEVPAAEAARELGSIAATPTFDALLDNLAFGPLQAGPAAAGSGPVTIGWGRRPALLRGPGVAGAGGVPVGAAALVRRLRPFPHLGPAKPSHRADQEQDRLNEPVGEVNEALWAVHATRSAFGRYEIRPSSRVRFGSMI